MEMYLNHADIQAEQPCGACRSQITVAGEVTIPGSLRETTSVLHSGAMAVVEKAEAMQDRISIGGRVVFCVLYTQGDSGRVDSIEAAADFSHLCDAPGVTAHAEVYAIAQVEQVSATVNGGRMTMRAVIRLSARAVSCGALDALTGIDGSQVEMRTEQITLRRTVGRGSADVLLREEFSLPADLAIQDTLGARATVVFHDTAGGQGRIGISGEVTIEAVHASDMPGKPLVVTRHTVPVSQSVEVTGETGEMLDGRITVKDVAVASQDMGDGERTLRAEVLLGLSAWSDKEETITLLTDAYTTSGDALRLESDVLPLRTGDRRMHAAESGKAALLLPDGAKPLRTMLAAFATPVLSSFTQQGSRLITEGSMEATLVYMTDDGDSPVSVQVNTPFRAAFAASAAPEDIVTLTAVNVESVPVTSDRVELRYILHADVEGVEAQPVSVVKDATAIPAAETTGDIVLYFTQPGEGTWDIARRYRIPVSELKQLNPDLTGEPKTGQGLVVWRRSAV